MGRFFVISNGGIGIGTAGGRRGGYRGLWSCCCCGSLALRGRFSFDVFKRLGPIGMEIRMSECPALGRSAKWSDEGIFPYR